MKPYVRRQPPPRGPPPRRQSKSCCASSSTPASSSPTATAPSRAGAVPPRSCSAGPAPACSDARWWRRSAWPASCRAAAGGWRPSARRKDGHELEVALTLVPVRMSQSLEFNGFLEALEIAAPRGNALAQLQQSHRTVVDWIHAATARRGTPRGGRAGRRHDRGLPPARGAPAPAPSEEEDDDEPAGGGERRRGQRSARPRARARAGGGRTGGDPRRGRGRARRGGRRPPSG